MPLYWFLLVVLSLGCGSVSDAAIEPSRTLIATAGLCLGWGLLAKCAALIATSQLQRNEMDQVAIVRTFERQLELLRWSALGAAAICLIGFGYAEWVEGLSISRSSMAGRAALLLVPGLSMVGLLWWVDHQFGVTHAFIERGWRRAGAELLAMFRLQAAWLILPVLLLLLLLDVVTAIPGIGSMGGGAIVAATAFLAVLAGLPLLVRRIWKMEPLQRDSEHAELLQIPAAAGFRHLPAYRWDTGGRACNAMIAGFIPRCRLMVLSDRLLDRLTTAEVSMIVLHELAHLRRWHVPIRMTVITPAWGLIAIASNMLPDADWVNPVTTLVSVLLTLVLLRWVSHQTELDADRVACRLAVEIADRSGTVPQTMREAAIVLADALLAVTADHPAARRETWLHPSVACRGERLREMGRLP